MSATPFQQHVSDLRQRVELALAGEMAQFEWPETLRAAAAYSLMAGGKRLRPGLVLLAAEVCGGDLNAAMPSACALEMIHTYSLIHDDLPAMDDDDYRRGRLTSHKVFGEAMAVLAGDVLLTAAFELVARPNGRNDQQRAELCLLLARAAGGAGMVGGQVLDLEAERGSLMPAEWPESDVLKSVSTNGNRSLVSARSADLQSVGSQMKVDSDEIDFKGVQSDHVQQLMNIHRRKTGALITVALEMGAVCAGADSAQRKALRDYGTAIGLAFQIADDLLDVTGSREKLGKNPGRDVDLGKLTYPSLLGMDESRRIAEHLIDQACSALEIFGDRSVWLRELAGFIVERDH
ncbi:MAG: polyprenyl synthetase family protein [Planctomycetaceae bacterium]|nr:polyprenyl synthetase family protein [Planctomycetaceae bacterium]